MEFEFFGKTMQGWKLFSAQDYFNFFMYILLGTCIFVWWARRLRKKRNDAYAVQTVAQTLTKLSTKDSILSNFANFTVANGLKSDILFLSSKGIYIFRCIGWGFKVWGSNAAPTWKVLDNKEERRIPNPRQQALEACQFLQKKLAKAGFDIPVQPVVVFTDPFDTPVFYLEANSCTMGLKELKKWYKSHPASPLPEGLRKAVEKIVND